MPPAQSLERLFGAKSEVNNTVVKVSIENFIKVGLMAVLFFAVARMASQRLNIPGLGQVVGG